MPRVLGQFAACDVQGVQAGHLLLVLALAVHAFQQGEPSVGQVGGQVRRVRVGLVVGVHVGGFLDTGQTVAHVVEEVRSFQPTLVLAFVIDADDVLQADGGFIGRFLIADVCAQTVSKIAVHHARLLVGDDGLAVQCRAVPFAVEQAEANGADVHASRRFARCAGACRSDDLAHSRSDGDGCLHPAVGNRVRLVGAAGFTPVAQVPALVHATPLA